MGPEKGRERAIGSEKGGKGELTPRVKRSSETDAEEAFFSRSGKGIAGEGKKVTFAPRGGRLNS